MAEKDKHVTEHAEPAGHMESVERSVADGSAASAAEGNASDAGDTTCQTVWTAANIVTTIRICLIPLFFVLLIAPWPSWFPGWAGATDAQPWVAAIAFALISLTDSLDGYLARSRNEVTTLGKFLDPLADKILVCAAMVGLIELGTLPSWIALVIIAREFIVSGLRMVASSEGVVIAASWYGKAKTFVTLIALILFMIKDSAAIMMAGPGFHQSFDVASWVIMIAAVILTIISMIDYFAKAGNTIGLFKKDTEKEIEGK